jgi:leader peptidase (prepilin peptidase) / N-methyltransferase
MIEQGLLVGWFFAVGAAIGSFLNVVVYRTPRGMSLITPPSHCPTCKHRIRWFDNIPIVAWLALGGRCRDCRSRISVRYPAVEAATACMFALLAATVFFFNGANLPAGTVHGTGNPVSCDEIDPRLYGILLYHLLLLCTLLAAGLIEIDGQDAPASLFAPALAVGVIAPWVYPYLRPVAAWPGLHGWLGSAADCIAGLAAGGTWGCLASLFKGNRPIFAGAEIGTVPRGVPLGLLCVGVFLGWQAVCGVGFVVVLLASAAAVLGKRRNNRLFGPLGAWLYALTLGWILAWSPIVDLVKRITG